MKNETLSKILKGTALAVSWLTISLLLLILDGRWKLLPKWLRIVLFVFSPLVLVLLATAALSCYAYYWDYYYPRHHFVRPRVVENIIGIRLPRYKVVEYDKGRRSFNGDYSDNFTLEFKEMPDSSFYQGLRNNGFEYRDGCYYFYLNWGSGLVKDEIIPKGEKGNYVYSMTICEGDLRFIVKVMEL